MNKLSIDTMLSCLADFAIHVVGDKTGKEVVRLSAPDRADCETLIWIASGRADAEKLIAASKAKVIICDADVKTDIFPEKFFIITDQPKLVFLRIGNTFFQEKPTPGIHPTAMIHPEAKIDPTAVVGPYVYIGRSEIGAGTVLEGHNYVYDQVILGNNVTILAGCHLGAPGLGHIYNEKGEYENFPHIGRVIIGDDVEIGVHSSVAKGALADTIIGQGCKIDCHVQIGHNVVLEEDVLVMANSMIGGSSRIKKKAVIAMSVSIADYVTIGESVHVGPGAVVVANVDNNQKVFARPAMVMPAKHRN